MKELERKPRAARRTAARRRARWSGAERASAACAWWSRPSARRTPSALLALSDAVRQKLGDAAVVLGSRGRRPRAPGGERRAGGGGARREGGRRGAAAAAGRGRRRRRPRHAGAGRRPRPGEAARGAGDGARRDRAGARADAAILALDHGVGPLRLRRSRIPSGTLATPLAVGGAARHARRGSRRSPRLVEEKGAERVVVGLPLTLRGRGGRAGRARRARLPSGSSGDCSVPVELHDERLTTRLAERTGGEGDADSRAAAHLLESYLARSTRGHPRVSRRTAARPGRSHARGTRGRAPRAGGAPHARSDARSPVPPPSRPPAEPAAASRATGSPRRRGCTTPPPAVATDGHRAAAAAPPRAAGRPAIALGVAARDRRSASPGSLDALFQPFKGDGGEAVRVTIPQGSSLCADRRPAGAGGRGVELAASSSCAPASPAAAATSSRARYTLRKDMSFTRRARRARAGRCRRTSSRSRSPRASRARRSRRSPRACRGNYVAASRRYAQARPARLQGAARRRASRASCSRPPTS